MTWTLRPISPADEIALTEFHDRCSEETHYLRFAAAKPQLRPAEAHYLCAVDDHGRGALVITASDDPRTGFTVSDDGSGSTLTDAELAFVIEDAYQGQGLGRSSSRRRSSAPTRKGFTRLVTARPQSTKPPSTASSRTCRTGCPTLRFRTADASHLSHLLDKVLSLRAGTQLQLGIVLLVDALIESARGDRLVADHALCRFSRVHRDHPARSELADLTDRSTRGTAPKMIGFLINLAVAAYLIVAKRLFGVAVAGKVDEDLPARDTSWQAIERATPPAFETAA